MHQQQSHLKHSDDWRPFSLASVLQRPGSGSTVGQRPTRTQPTDTKLGQLSPGTHDAVRQLLSQGNLNLEDATQRPVEIPASAPQRSQNPTPN